MKTVMKTKASLMAAFFVVLVLVSVLVPDEHLNALGTGILFAMLIPANYFPVFYTVAFRWWGGHLGRALFIKALGLAIVLDVVLLVKFFGGEAWADELRFVAYALVCFGMYYQSIVMTQIRMKAKALRSETEPEAQTDIRGVDRHHERHHDTL